MRKKSIIIIIFFILVIILWIFKYCESNQYSISDYNSINDSLRIYKDKYNREVATTSLITNIGLKDFLNLKSNDSLILKLQQELKRYQKELKNGGSTTIIDNSTEISDATISKIIDSLSTRIKKGDTIYVYPAYYCADSTRWYNYSLMAKLDSCKLNFKVENEYAVIIGERREKWYKKKQPFVDVINNNPYTKTKALKAFKVTDKTNNRFGLGFGVGVGVTPKGIEPCIYGGLQYMLIKF